MSEPIQPRININTEPNPEVLQRVLDALTVYKNELLMSHSHSDQSPEQVIALKTILRDKARQIRGFLLYKRTPSDTDEKLKECLESLKASNTPWDPNISVLTNYWCDMIFVKYPFVMNDKHIKNLLKNSTQSTDESYQV